MDQNKETIWVYNSISRQELDNDYYFYEDGTILHCYDRTMNKLNIEEYVTESDISEYEKSKILAKCESECNSDIVNRIKSILAK